MSQVDICTIHTNPSTEFLLENGGGGKQNANKRRKDKGYEVQKRWELSQDLSRTG
jgi:hypothetical protein